MSRGTNDANVDDRALDAAVGEFFGGRECLGHHRAQRHDRRVRSAAQHLRRTRACRRSRRRARPSSTRRATLASRKITGSSSRIEAAISPMTSTALLGTTTLRPGIIIAQFSTLWECWAPKRKSAAVARADHQREGQLAVRHVATLGDLVGDDVPADGEEVREHDLGDRSQPGHRGAHRRAEDGLLARSGCRERAPVRTPR